MWNNARKKQPPMDEDVIIMDKHGRIAFGHIVDPTIAVSHDGWNIPDVAFWMQCDFTTEMLKYYNQY